jgi:hypothetical protein
VSYIRITAPLYDLKLLLGSFSQLQDDKRQPLARALEIDYVWIDNVCIIQDDDNDWIMESSKMAAIYANSYLNILIVSADAGSGPHLNT